jgi:hypothetical protein
MRLSILITALVFFVQISMGQVETEVKESKTTHTNLIKIGGSLQGDVYFGFNDYYYDDFYYIDYMDKKYPSGFDAATFVAFEHIWQFPSNIAVSLEPKAGFSMRSNSNSLFLGNDIKLYWANRKNWRMGIALSTDYYYSKYNSGRVVSKGDGNYAQWTDLKLSAHYLNIDFSIVPFQFRLSQVPLIFELQFSMFGIGIYFERSELYDLPDGSRDRFNDRTFIPYLFKTEFKIGYVLP